jgi:hypothetical protein
MKLTLYTGPYCELCDRAIALVEQLEHPDLTLEAVNIRTSTDLYHLYAVRIPVLKKEDGAELGWPFDLQQLRAFVE